MKRIIQIGFFAGLLLLGINISGLFKTMRNPEIYSEEKTIRNRLNDITIGYPEILGLLKRKNNESNIDFAVRINKVVNDGFIHYWKEEGTEKYHLRVPLWENWILFAASYIILKNTEDMNSAITKKPGDEGQVYVPPIQQL